MEERRAGTERRAIDRGNDRRRGRPRSETPMERIDLRLPPGLLDALCRESLRRGIGVSILARRIIAAHFLSVEKSRVIPSP